VKVNDVAVFLIIIYFMAVLFAVSCHFHQKKL